MRCALWAFGLLAVLVGCPADTHAEPPPGPLVFPDGDIDLGVARQQDELAATATVRNDGPRALTKMRTLSDCGCYSATLSATSLAPGKEATVSIRFRTLSFYGPMAKRLRVAYLDGSRQATSVKIKVTVAAGVIVRPGRVYFGQVPADAKPEGHVSILWYEGAGRPFEVTGVDVPNAKVRTVVEPHADGRQPRWKGWKITFQFTEPPPRGLFRREAKVRTTSKEQPVVTVPITGQVVGKVWVQSNRIFLGLVPKGLPRSAHVLFRPSDRAVTLDPERMRARSVKGLLRVAIKPAPTRREPGLWRLDVSVPEDAPLGPLDDDVVVHTGLPGEPETTFHVTGSVIELKRQR